MKIEMAKKAVNDMVKCEKWLRIAFYYVQRNNPNGCLVYIERILSSLPDEPVGTTATFKAYLQRIRMDLNTDKPDYEKITGKVSFCRMVCEGKRKTLCSQLDDMFTKAEQRQVTKQSAINTPQL